ncbi:hypothetical protein DJ64_32655 [Streptomyces griseorubens]|uniref:DUF1275 domain-containing protein n=2 Tax=Streptomyces griseorubens TaxID=66897 RepID=A0ABR4T4C5_9ACTN|nr:hypothetical protein DJ64_32655 [Streptomyces griseorubens]
MTVLTVISGAVDAVSFLTLGKVFCALVTGNVLFLSFALAGEGDVPVERAATAVAAFAAGAALGALTLAGLAAGRRRVRGGRRARRADPRRARRAGAPVVRRGTGR